MLWYIVKVVVMFTFAIAVLRMMGKSTIAQVTPHDLVAIIIIAALATNPIVDKDFGKTLVAIAVVATIHILFAKLTLYSWGNRFILGEPTILVKHGKIIRKNLRRSEISLAELLSYIRAKGFPDVHEVQYAILEPTGTISVLPRDDLYPVTPRHLDLETPYRGLALSLVVDGKIQERNLELIGKDAAWLKEELRKRGYDDVRGVMYAAMMDHTSKLYVDDGEGESGINPPV